MKKAIAVMMLLAGGLLAAPRVTVGIGIGIPAPVAVVPACPGPGYTWVNGYYGPAGVWVGGYWRGPAVVRIAPPLVHPRVDRRVERFDHFRR